MNRSERMMYIFKPEDVRDLLRDILATGKRPKAAIVRDVCSCGCGKAIQIARDERALWVCSETNAIPRLHAVGLETLFDVERFLGALTVSEKELARTRALLLRLFNEGLS